MAMRHLPEGGRIEESGDDRGHGNRLRVQQHTVQPGQGADSQEAISFELLLAFTRHLIHWQVAGDALFMAMRAAQTDTGATVEQMKRLARAVQSEHTAHKVWPPGF